MNSSSKPALSHLSLRNQYLASVGPWFAALLTSYNAGITSSTVADLTDAGSLTLGQAEWFASLYFAGGLLGSSMAGVLADAWGRQLTMMVGTALSAIGLLLVLLDVHFSVTLFGRLLCGVHYGVRGPTAAMYQVETTSESVRGTVTFIGGALTSIGLLMSFALRIVLSWTWMIVVGLVTSLAGIISLSLLPESPRWYAKCQRYDEARASLTWLYMNDASSVDLVLTDIIESLRNKDKQVTLNAVDRRMVKPILLAILVMLGLPLSGNLAMMSFLWQLERAAGIRNEALATAGVGIFQVTLFLFITPLLNKAGRLAFIALFGAMTTVSLLMLVVSDMLRQYGTWTPDSAVMTWILPLVSYLGLLISQAGCVGWRTLSYLVMAELLPTRLRALGSGLSVSIMLLLGAISCQIFLPMTDLIQLYGTFLVYAVLNTLITVLVIVYVPETRDKTLEDIQRMFELTE